MKKALYTAIAALAAAACTSTEYIDVDNLDPELVINAQMTSYEDVHTIHLSSSSRSKVSPVPEGTVTVRINSGAPIATVWEPLEDREEFSSSKFIFTDKLNPGDVVEVTGSYGSLKAKATVTVPAVPNLLDVEYNHDVKHSSATSDSIFGGDYYSDWWPYSEPNPYPGDTWHEVKIKFTDRPGTNDYYRVSVVLETILTTDEGVEINQGDLDLDTSSEPVLSTASSSDGGILDTYLSDSNRYCIFDDKMFKDKEYTLKLYFQEYQVMYNRKSHDHYDYAEQDENYLYIEPPLPEGWSYKANILVRLFSISLDQYIYLKALDLNDNDFGRLFSEPVSIPSNVDGGMGFVNVDSCKEIRLDL